MENTIDPLVTRCEWNLNHALLTQYHDEEWGEPLHDDRMLFEFRPLDGCKPD